MITLQSVDVCNVLRELADKVESGQLHPRQVVLGEDRLEMDFYVRYRIGTAEGSGKGS